MNFKNYIADSSLVIPPSVEATIQRLNLRLKDVLWTLNFPMKEKPYPGQREDRRERWFGSYWVGMLCKWSQSDEKWVILACWKTAAYG